MDDVHVWLVPLDSRTVLTSAILSAEETTRAARFVFDRDRAHYIVAHTAVRQILAPYAGQKPESLVIETAERGKPYLRDHPQLRFNLSHSGEYALLAVGDRELGVDIERINAKRSTIEIAKRFFAPAEVADLLATPEDRREEAFFACWSRKEAYIKARGEGLGIPLDSFTVSLGSNAGLRQASDRERWWMCALQAPTGYAAALAAEAPRRRITQLTWPQES